MFLFVQVIFSPAFCFMYLVFLVIYPASTSFPISVACTCICTGLISVKRHWHSCHVHVPSVKLIKLAMENGPYSSHLRFPEDIAIRALSKQSVPGSHQTWPIPRARCRGWEILETLMPKRNVFSWVLYIGYNNVINHPFGNDLYHVFMVILGMVYYVFTHSKSIL